MVDLTQQTSALVLSSCLLQIWRWNASRFDICQASSYSQLLHACHPSTACSIAADLQMVNITLRVLSKPDVEQLPKIFRVRAAPDGPPICRTALCTPMAALVAGWAPAGARLCAVLLPCCCRAADARCFALLPCLMQNLGTDWDERVLPSIGNEVLKAVVAQYQAEQLLTQVGCGRGGSLAGGGRRTAGAQLGGKQLLTQACAGVHLRAASHGEGAGMG